MQLPKIGVMSTRTWPGANSLSADEDVRDMEQVPFDDAFDRRFRTDAHFVNYRPTGTSQSRFPRCNKPFLQAIRADSGDLLAHMIVLDFDNPGHAPWSSAGWKEFCERFTDLAETWPLSWQWARFYTTRGGARLVYVLDTPSPVEVVQGYTRWIVEEFCKRGIEMDRTCDDWTRLFRLPQVVREDKPSWGGLFYENWRQDGQVVAVGDLGSIEKGAKGGAKAEIRELDFPQPDLEEAMLLVQKVEGRGKWTVWANSAKARLKGRQCYAPLFEHAKIAEPGHRHDTILRLVGQAVTLLFRLTDDDGLRTTTPTHIYGLFSDPVMQLEDDGRDDWLRVMWKHTLYCWAREVAEQEQLALDDAEEAKDALGQLDTIVAGMRQWCDHPALFKDPETARQWAHQHLIAVSAKCFHLIRKDGRYDTMTLNHQTLFPRIRALGLEALLPTIVPANKGHRTVSVNEMISQFGTPYSLILGIPGIPGATMERIDEPDAFLRMPLFHVRTDLKPTYSQAVDTWLRHFFGDNYEEGCNWIAHSLDPFGGPICALSLAGWPGIGKKLLVNALAECISTQSFATAEDLVGGFQPGIMRSLFLWVDEGMPKGNGGKHPADIFRELTGGGARWVNRKFLEPVQVMNPLRIVITANNLDVIKSLAAERDLSPEDRQALGIRIMHFDLTDSAEVYLRHKGGKTHTKGWIKGDAGQRSNFTAARHMLWIRDHMRLPAGRRLLVEGNAGNTLMFRMRSQGGAAPIVVEAILAMWESNATNTFNGLAEHETHLYVIPTEILKYWRLHLASSSPVKLTAGKVSKILRGLVTRETTKAFLIPGSGIGNKLWHQLDVPLLIDAAKTDGWPSERLIELHERQIAAGIS